MKNYTYEELLKDMNILGRYCDLVRTVDHQSCRVCTLKKENGRVTARTMYRCGGTVCHHNTDLWRMTTPVGAHRKGSAVFAFWPMASG